VRGRSYAARIGAFGERSAGSALGRYWRRTAEPTPSAPTSTAKRLQSGRLDAYLLYMLIALIAVIATVSALA
jgi:hypothetical protein